VIVAELDFILLKGTGTESGGIAVYNNTKRMLAVKVQVSPRKTEIYIFGPLESQGLLDATRR